MPILTPAHPAVAPVIEALRALATYQPTGVIDLANVLASLHGYGFDNVIDALADVLDHFGECSRAGVENGVALPGDVAEQLSEASSYLTGYVGCDRIDRARACTGHFLGSRQR